MGHSFDTQRGAWGLGKWEEGIKPYHSLLYEHPGLQQVWSLGPCYVVLYSVTRHGYVYISSSVGEITGHSPEAFFLQGRDFIANNVSTKDLDRLVEAGRVQFAEMRKLRPAEKLACVQRYAYHFQHTNGLRILMLEQMVVLALDSKDNPNLLLSIVADASMHTHDPRVRLVLCAMESAKSRVAANFSIENLPFLLTRREESLLELLAAGLPFSEVAAQMGILPRTLMAYSRNLLLKTQATSIEELIVMGEGDTPEEVA